jgi:hypothetical protein
MNGISFLISIGKFAYPSLSFNSKVIRICLGPISFVIFFLDLERWLAEEAKKHGV